MTERPNKEDGTYDPEGPLVFPKGASPLLRLQFLRLKLKSAEMKKEGLERLLESGAWKSHFESKPEEKEWAERELRVAKIEVQLVQGKIDHLEYKIEDWQTDAIIEQG